MTIPACEAWWMVCIEIAVVALFVTVAWLFFENLSIRRGLRRMREEQDAERAPPHAFDGTTTDKR